jgi:hypothetical protein
MLVKSVSSRGVYRVLCSLWVDGFRTSAEAIDLGRPYWILHPTSWHTPEAAATFFKYSWGWMQKSSETCRVILQLLINILPSGIALVPYIFWLMMHGNSYIKVLLFLWLILSHPSCTEHGVLKTVPRYSRDLLQNQILSRSEYIFG